MFSILDGVILKAENSIPGVRFTTAFLGNIPTGLSDDIIEPLLRACGPLRRWKRPLTPGGFLPKPFGFAEFSNADGLLRCKRLLSGLPLAADMSVSIKLDDATVEYLTKYETILLEILNDLHLRNTSLENVENAIEIQENETSLIKEVNYKEG